MSCVDLTTNSRRRHSGSGESRIPVPNSPSPLRRSGSQRLGGCPPIQEQSPSINRHRSLQSLTTTPLTSRLSSDHDDDLDSLRSYGSCASACSTASQCDHAHFARNGTTYSGRRRRYVVHCSPQNSAGDEYLTPTQRSNRTIRKLKTLLSEAQAEIEEKDRQLFRLTKEVVQLRLLKVDSGTDVVEPDSSSRLSDQNEQGAASSHGGGLSPPLVVDLPPSLADSGHFEDLTNGKDWSPRPHREPTFRDLEILQRQHEDMVRDLKEKQNDRVDSLLLRITETNDRYYELRPTLDIQQSRIKELEEENEKLKRDQSAAQTKIEDLTDANVRLRLHVQTIENKLNEIDISNVNIQLGKLENDSKKILELEKENDALKLLIDNKKNQEIGMECRLNSILQENEELKLENFKLCELNEQLKEKDEKCVVEMETVEGAINKLKVSNCMTETVNNCDRVKELEKEIETLKEAQKEQEEYHKTVYLEMYKKGQEAARFECGEMLEQQKQEETSAASSDLLKKLEITQAELDNVKDREYISSENLLSAKEAVSLWILGTRKDLPMSHLSFQDSSILSHPRSNQAMYRRILETKKNQPDHDPEMTLQFLKSAIYYFLTDKENTQGHLAAIESILGFTENEKINIDKAYLWR